MKISTLLTFLLPLASFGQIQFTDTIPEGMTRASAGLYNGEKLIRTIYNNRKVEAGVYTEKFSALTDDFNKIESLEGLKVKRIANNMQFDWGVFGNSSTDLTGSGVHRSFSPITEVFTEGNFGYYVTDYNEGGLNQAKFNKASLGKRILLPNTGAYVLNGCTDGVNLYWGAWDLRAGSEDINKRVTLVFATKIADDLPFAFSSGASYVGAISLPSVISKAVGNIPITGMAVQRNGKYLFVARKELNKIDVFDKKTGLFIRKDSVYQPSEIRIDNNGLLWVVSGTDIKKYRINSAGSITAILSIVGIEQPINIAVSPDNKTLLVADAGTQQLKAFSTSTGGKLWVFGEAGGYSNSPNVTDSKFYWKDLRDTFRVALNFSADGSFWVGDPGNDRLQHYSDSRQFIERLSYRSHSYSLFTCNNDSSRIFSDYLEFKIDYSKPFASPEFATLVKNWGGNMNENLSNQKNRLRGVTTLSNGRTYAVVPAIDSNYFQVMELPPNGNIRLCQRIPIIAGYNGAYLLYEDGSLRIHPRSGYGVPMIWKQQKLQGFDSINNPIWGPQVVIDYSPSRTYQDPGPNNLRRTVEITSTGLLIAYDGSTPKIDSPKYHLGAIKNGEWVWRAAPQTFGDYEGDFPEDGAYDIGNSVIYGGDMKHYALDRFIITGYHGEFWKGTQTNMYNLWYDNGLMIGQFGVAEINRAGDSPFGRAGNALGGGFVKAGSNYYLYTSDEFSHSAVHVWKLTNPEVRESVLDVQFNNDVDTNTVELMQNLPFNQFISSGKGWAISPDTLDFTDRQRKWWEVKTNVRAHSKFELPDVFVQWASKVPQTNNVARDLGINDLDKWSLTGRISYAGNVEARDVPVIFDEKGANGSFLDVLDKDGGLIFRFFQHYNKVTGISTIYANKTIIAQGPQIAIEDVTKHYFDFSLTASGGLRFKMADYPEILLPTNGDLRTPTTLRVYCWTNGTAASVKMISLKDFKFIK